MQRWRSRTSSAPGGCVASRQRRPRRPCQMKVMSEIESCRTAARPCEAWLLHDAGMSRCEDCRHTAIAYNSCRNRHCLKCQGTMPLLRRPDDPHRDVRTSIDTSRRSSHRISAKTLPCDAFAAGQGYQRSTRGPGKCPALVGRMRSGWRPAKRALSVGFTEPAFQVSAVEATAS